MQTVSPRPPLTEAPPTRTLNAKRRTNKRAAPARTWYTCPAPDAAATMPRSQLQRRAAAPPPHQLAGRLQKEDRSPLSATACERVWLMSPSRFVFRPSRMRGGARAPSHSTAGRAKPVSSKQNKTYNPKIYDALRHPEGKYHSVFDPAACHREDTLRSVSHRTDKADVWGVVAATGRTCASPCPEQHSPVAAIGTCCFLLRLPYGKEARGVGTKRAACQASVSASRKLRHCVQRRIRTTA